MHKRFISDLLIVSPIFPPYVGGAAKYYKNLAVHLSRLVRVVVLTRMFPGKPLREVRRNLLIYRILPSFTRYHLLDFAVNFIAIPAALVFLYITHKPKIIHLHSTSAGITRTSLAWTRIFRFSVVLDIRDELFGRFVKRKNVQWYVTLTSQIAERLKSYGISSNRISVIRLPRPVITPALKRIKFDPKDSEDKVTFIFAGFLTRNKGVDLLLRAFKEVADASKAELVIVGDGSLRGFCQEFVTDNGLQNKVKLIGSLPHEEALLKIALSDVLVLPSFSEAWPNVVMEALEMRKPVIATNVGGVSELVKHGVNGLLFPPGRIDLLANHMFALTENRLRKKLSCGYTTNKTTSWNQVAHSLCAIYTKVLSALNVRS